MGERSLLTMPVIVTILESIITSDSISVWVLCPEIQNQPSGSYPFKGKPSLLIRHGEKIKGWFEQNSSHVHTSTGAIPPRKKHFIYLLTTF